MIRKSSYKQNIELEMGFEPINPFRNNEALVVHGNWVDNKLDRKFSVYEAKNTGDAFASTSIFNEG